MSKDSSTKNIERHEQQWRRLLSNTRKQCVENLLDRLDGGFAYRSHKEYAHVCQDEFVELYEEGVELAYADKNLIDFYEFMETVFGYIDRNITAPKPEPEPEPEPRTDKEAEEEEA